MPDDAMPHVHPLLTGRCVEARTSAGSHGARLSLGLALGLLTSACSGGAASAAKYVPEGAQFMVGLAPAKALSASGQQAVLDDLLDKDLDLKELIGVAQGCKLDPFVLEQVVVGANIKQEFTAVLVGPGFGKSESVTCFFEASYQGPDPDEGKVTVEGKKITLDGDTVAFAVDDKTLVVSSPGWAAAAGKLVDGRAGSAVDGTMKAAVGLVDTDEHFWVIADATSEIGTVLTKELGAPAGVKLAAMSLDFSGGGLALAAAGKFADDAGATAAADLLNKGADQAKGMASAVGLPSGLVESLSVSSSGTKLSVSAKASAEDVTAMVKAMNTKPAQEMEPAQ